MSRKTHAALWGACLMLAAAPLQAATLINTQVFLNRFFGVNVHLDNCCNGNYGSTSQVIGELQYIGATHLRSGPIPMGGLFEKWQTVYNATQAPFNAVIPGGSPQRQRDCLKVAQDWLTRAPGMIRILEGGNEEDTSHPKSQGATLGDTAALQTDIYNAGHAAGVNVTQMSVGAGWAPPLWEGNYKNFGKPPADFGNAHIYSNKGEVPAISLKRIGELAGWSVDGKAIEVTEYGIFKGSEETPALTSAYMHIAPFTSYLLGHASLSVYALHDDSTNVVGFYDSKGVKRGHAYFWHATTRLLADPGGKNLPTKEANITFTDQRSTGTGAFGIKNVPMYKSDDSIWVAVYDEEKSGAGEAYETVTLDRNYPYLQVIDGRTGVTVFTAANARKVSLHLRPNYLIFVVGSNSKVSVKL